MRIAAIFVTLLGFALLGAACSGCPSGKYANCNVSWDFYGPCDLLEGRNARCCQPDPCGVEPCGTGVVMVTNDCVPVSGGMKDAVVIQEEVIEEPAAPEEVPEVPAGGDGE